MSKFIDFLAEESVAPYVVVYFVCVAIFATYMLSSYDARHHLEKECREHGVVVLIDDKAVCKYEKSVTL